MSKFNQLSPWAQLRQFDLYFKGEWNMLTEEFAIKELKKRVLHLEDQVNGLQRVCKDLYIESHTGFFLKMLRKVFGIYSVDKYIKDSDKNEK